MKLLAVITLTSGFVVASVAHAGGAGGCIYGGHGNSMANLENEATPPVAANEADPKWLALQKRLQLEADSQIQDIQVPN